VPQIAFKPDWTKHAKAAPFKRNDAMLTRFAASVGGGGPEFVAMPYPELWSSWGTCLIPNGSGPMLDA